MKGQAMYTENRAVSPADLGGGVKRRILSYSNNLMAAELTFPKGAAGAKHSHPHEQIGYIVHTELSFKQHTHLLCRSECCARGGNP